MWKVPSFSMSFLPRGKAYLPFWDALSRFWDEVGVSDSWEGGVLAPDCACAVTAARADAGPVAVASNKKRHRLAREVMAFWEMGCIGISRGLPSKGQHTLRVLWSQAIGQGSSRVFAAQRS